MTYDKFLFILMVLSFLAPCAIVVMYFWQKIHIFLFKKTATKTRFFQ